MQLVPMGNAARLVMLICMVLGARLAQGQGIVEIAVVDSISKEPVELAEVSMEAGQVLGRTDTGGVFVYRFSGSTGSRLVIRRFGYLPSSTVVRSGTARLLVELVPDGIVLPDYAAKRSAPEVIFQSDTLHAAMFEPGADGLWVLAYAHPRMWRDQARAGVVIYRDVVLVLMDTLLNEVARKPVPGECTGLHIGRKGEAYVLGTDRVWSVMYTDDRITFKTMVSAIFEEALRPWTDSLAGHWLGSDFDPTYPGFDHLAYEPVSDIVSIFCSVQDTFVMELFRSQYKYMSGHDKVVAMDAALRTGTDRETWAGYMTGFHNDLYFKAPYAPSFVRNDTILVFDHTAGQLRRFTARREPIDIIPFAYHKGRSGRAWTGRVMQDRSNGDVYALFEQDGRNWLCAIDPGTGELGPKRMLDGKWPEQVRVHGGHAYYTHRPFESVQKRTLYRERL
ncbi:MAG: hypothetical protein KA230_08560 [Flavobacteriales bacterium]|nr:hypothetical protein [Flavobacteriales bacterium]